MRFSEKIVVFLLRPIYRAFFERLLHWHLIKFKQFLLAETVTSLADLTARIEQIERSISAGADPGAMQELLRQNQTSSAAQWSAIETLLLAMFRQSGLSNADLANIDNPKTRAAVASLHEVNASDNIR